MCYSHGRADISDSKIVNHIDLSKHFDSSVQLLKKYHLCIQSVKLKCLHHRFRVVKFQRDKTSYVASPRANISRLKPRTLSLVISSLKFPEKKNIKEAILSHPELWQISLKR